MNKTPKPPALPWVSGGVAILFAVLSLTLVSQIYAAGHTVWAVVALTFFAITFYLYAAKTTLAYRYLFPALAAMAVFVAFPLLFTAQMGFTNYSSAHLLSEARVRTYLLEQSWPAEADVMGFTLHEAAGGFTLALKSPSDALAFVSPVIALKNSSATNIAMSAGAAPASAALPLIEVLKHRTALQALTLTLPDQRALTYAGVREFAPRNPVWKANADQSLTLAESGTVYRANDKTGFFESAEGSAISPGFKVGVGFDNYTRMITDPDFRGPFISIFIWTVFFSALTVFFTVALGMPLAVLLNWEALPFRNIYRTLLFLPYAVPAFISILVFKGLFNQNFGEINAILNALIGVKPAWFADPWLAKAMILIVNTWLGYPYIMILCSGLIKAIPADLYEASAIAGATPLTNFFRITMPLILKPLTPLLITVFAFNFNNFVVISLLTDGRPDFLNTKLPAGTTDILVSYTYRIAFQDSGQNFGLAAAISTVIFLMVVVLSIANLKLVKWNAKG